NLRILVEGFADDVSVFTKPCFAQYFMDGTDMVLVFLRMKSKPSKCRSIAFGRVDTRVHCFDPEVRISGAPIDMVKESDGFKLLGRYFFLRLDLARQQLLVSEKLEKNIAKLDATLLTGPQRVHALRMSLNGWLAWDLSMYDFCVTFVEEKLDQPVKNAIARWLK